MFCGGGWCAVRGVVLSPAHLAPPLQYDEYKTPMDNIGMQDSLLSRFDLIFIVLDEVSHVTLYLATPLADSVFVSFVY